MKEDTREFVEKYELAVAFAEEFIAELGAERAMPAMARAFEKIQVRAGTKLAADLGGNSCAVLGEHLRRRAEELPTLEVLEADDRHVALRISRCRASEAFRHLGAPEICRLYCDSDHAFIRAFNPSMELIRTKTLAGGDECCDHVWAVAECEAIAGPGESG